MGYKVLIGRKVPKTFSLDYRVLGEFLDLCQKQGISPNHTVERLLRSYIINYRDATKVKFIICPKCGAKYSELLKKCPKCGEPAPAADINRLEPEAEALLNAKVVE